MMEGELAVDGIRGQISSSRGPQREIPLPEVGNKQ